jgi:catechol 2,3-dioxygenase-like lactoylglutathione lyase family enzyme
VPETRRARRPAAVLDHVAVGVGTLADGWELFAGLLGGTWAYGDYSPGFWWGQLQFSAGPKIELLTPTGGADAAFLERFLADRGPGFHHLNFIVPAIEVTLGKIRALGVEPIGVSLQNPQWKEAFLRPPDGYGTVIQVAEQAGAPPSSRPPTGLAEPGRSCSLSLIEQRVADIDGAVRLFQEALDGEVVGRADTAGCSVAELSWQNGARLRLVQSAGDSQGSVQPAEGIALVQFSRDAGTFGPTELEEAAVVSRRLGISVRLGGIHGSRSRAAAAD